MLPACRERFATFLCLVHRRKDTYKLTTSREIAVPNICLDHGSDQSQEQGVKKLKRRKRRSEREEMIRCSFEFRLQTAKKRGGISIQHELQGRPSGDVFNEILAREDAGRLNSPTGARCSCGACACNELWYHSSDSFPCHCYD